MHILKKIRKHLDKKKRNNIKKQFCNGVGPVKLHIGSGNNYKQGWINIDANPKKKTDVLYDLSMGIPFPDNSVDYIFNEHFIEHLSYEDGLKFMKESYRVLKPNGVIRIACPDLKIMVEDYLNDTWRTKEWVKSIKANWYPTRCFTLNQGMREHGAHKYLYDTEELVRRLESAGFYYKNIKNCEIKKSEHKELQDIEWRQDSIVVEAKKHDEINSDILLTAHIITYNQEDSIAKAIDSVLEQKTNFNFEILISDDCSTDRTSEICREYKNKYPNKIRLIMNEKNLGTAKSIYQSMCNIKTKYIAMLEGDDYWCDENKLQEQVDALEANPDCSMCGHDTLVNKDNEQFSFIKEVIKYEIKPKYSLDEPFRVHLSSRVMRNVVDLSKYHHDVIFDTVLYILYMTKGNLYYIDKIMSVYNSTGQGIWSSKGKEEREMFAMETAYSGNKCLGFKYDSKFLPNDKKLRKLKKVFGKRLGWFIFYNRKKRKYKNNKGIK